MDYELDIWDFFVLRFVLQWGLGNYPFISFKH
jgi:hypothetical protein